MICCCGCPAYEDLFDENTLTTDYSTKAGSFSHSGDEVTTSSSGARIIANFELPSDRGRVVTVAKASTSGLKVTLYGAYVDENNYIFAEFVVNTGFPAGSVTIIKRASGSNTQQATQSVNLNADEFYTFQLCWDGTKVLARVNSATLGLLANLESNTSPSSGGNQGGFGGDASGGTLTFDEFTIEGHEADSDKCPNCLPCDGVIYEDDFTTLNTGWGLNPSFPSTDFAVTGGEFKIDKGGGGSGVVDRCIIRPTLAGSVITFRFKHYWRRRGLASHIGAYGLVLNDRASTANWVSLLIVRGSGLNHYRLFTPKDGGGFDESTLIEAADEGDEVELVLTEIGSNRFDVECYINGNLEGTHPNVNIGAQWAADPIHVGFNNSFSDGHGVGGVGSIIFFDDFHYDVEYPE